jgi:hypothetical protein
MDDLDAQLTAAMPKPPTPLASHDGTVIVDSAAVRDYNPDDGSLHHDVSVVGPRRVYSFAHTSIR